MLLTATKCMPPLFPFQVCTCLRISSIWLHFIWIHVRSSPFNRNSTHASISTHCWYMHMVILSSSSNLVRNVQLLSPYVHVVMAHPYSLQVLYLYSSILRNISLRICTFDSWMLSAIPLISHVHSSIFIYTLFLVYFSATL